MLKVLHVYKNYAPTPGGIESHIRQVAQGMTARHLAKVTVLVANAGPTTTYEDMGGVRVIRAARLGELASTPLSFDLVRQISRETADVIHLHVPYPVGELGYLLTGRGRRVVITYHSDVVRQWWARPLYEPMLHIIASQARPLIATSPRYVETSAFLRSLPRPCTIIPLGIDADRFVVAPEKSLAARSRWPQPLVLFVGRFRAYKGLPNLIEAVAGLKCHLLLVGAGPAEAALRKLINERGLPSQVLILNHVTDDELPDLYAACSVFVLPSIYRSEAYGISLLEAMASGRPVISTELGTGTSWINEDGKTGLVVPPNDPGALRSAIERLLADRDWAEKLGEAGRSRVCANYTEDLMIDRLWDAYENGR